MYYKLRVKGPTKEELIASANRNESIKEYDQETENLDTNQLKQYAIDGLMALENESDIEEIAFLVYQKLQRPEYRRSQLTVSGRRQQ